MASIPRQIPLFPLPDVVLFPHLPLPLHVFEPRYRRLVEDVRQGDGVIGMVLLWPGWEGDYEGRPPVYPVGCAGRLEACEELPDGRFDVLLRGLARFRIVGEQPGRPYRLATVEPLPDPPGDLSRVGERRKRLLAAIARAPDGPEALVLQGELPDEVFVNALAQGLGLSPVEKQSVLEAETVADRYERLLEVHEFRVLEQTWGTVSKGVH